MSQSVLDFFFFLEEEISEDRSCTGVLGVAGCGVDLGPFLPLPPRFWGREVEAEVEREEEDLERRGLDWGGCVTRLGRRRGADTWSMKSGWLRWGPGWRRISGDWTSGWWGALHSFLYLMSMRAHV